jgi:hypothetical protein
MLSEGILLYLLVVRVFGNMAKRWYLLLILGWGKNSCHRCSPMQAILLGPSFLAPALTLAQY